MSTAREILLAQQDTFLQTGLDFVSVDVADHRKLTLYFAINPDDLDDPITEPDDLKIRIRSLRDGHEIFVLTKAFRTIDLPDARMVLDIVCEEEGGFEFYSLEVKDLIAARMDVFSNTLRFSFKQSCPSPFDCADQYKCPPKASGQIEIDYLARDFESYLKLFYEYSGHYYPHWDLNNPADQAVMIAELIAAVGDETALLQDQYFNEGQFSQLTQRRSFAGLAQIVDYQLKPETGASGYIILRHYDGFTNPREPITTANVPAGAKIWGRSDSAIPVPFEVGQSLEDILEDNVFYPTQSNWTDLPVYNLDPNCPCLEKGVREIFIEGHDFDEDLIDPGTPVMLQARAANPYDPPISFILELDQNPKHMVDSLNDNLPITRLHFASGLPFDVATENGFISANIVPVISGETIKTRFQIGKTDEELPSTIEREGPVMGDPCAVRPIIHRFSLRETTHSGLFWLEKGAEESGTLRYSPEVVLHQENENGAVIATWEAAANSLQFQSTDERVAIDYGIYGSVFQYYDKGQYHQFEDYLGDQGYTVRFGNGEFGIEPAQGMIFSLYYRSCHQEVANLPIGFVNSVTPPENVKHHPNIAEMPIEIRSVENPLEFNNARAGEPLSIAREIAPHGYKSENYRAVRDIDYTVQSEKLDIVQSAHSLSRWTGMWVSTFVYLDYFVNLGGESDVNVAKAKQHLELVRQAGQHVISLVGKTKGLYLDIVICTEAGFVFANIQEQIIDRLAGIHSEAFFHPDRFKFGSTIKRAELERLVGAIKGVRRVLSMRYRLGVEGNYEAFDSDELTLAADQIFELRNDPQSPEAGALRIFEGTYPEEGL